ncbi:MAG: arsenate reductase family protein [Psychroflexus salarius]|jgi:arsenate reductase
MKKVFYLSTCDTCKKIIDSLNLPSDLTLQDIKKEPISSDELKFLKNEVDSYKDLLNKRARIYKELNLKNRELSEDETKTLILEHYTLLKRPVFVYNEKVFIGNSKATKTALQDFFNES